MIKNTITLFIATSLSFCLSTYTYASNNDLNTKLKKTQQAIEKTKQNLQQSRKKKNTLDSQLFEIENTMNQLVKQLYTLEKNLTQQQQTIKKLQSEIKLLQTQTNQTQTVINEQFKKAYVVARQSPWKLLLHAGSSGEATQLLAYYGRIKQSYQQQLSQQQKRMQQLEQTQVQLRQQQLLQQRLRTEKQQQANKLKQNKAQHQHLISEIDGIINSSKQALDTLAYDEKMLRKKLNRITQSTNYSATHPKYPRNNSGTLSLKWPIQPFSLTQLHAAKHPELLNRYVIPAQVGTPVYAVQQGKVVFSDWLRGFGLLLIIEHTDGYMSLYGHNQALLKQIDEKVHAGEQIAFVGQSGGHKQASLYFEMRKLGKPIYLEDWFK